MKLSDFLKKTSVKVICSVLLSIICWFAVVTSISPEDDRQIKNVPVNIEIPMDLDLNVVETSTSNVTVNVTGSRYNIGSLSNKDISIKTLFTDVTKPGQYELKLIAVPPPDNIYKVTSIYPDTITVTFDRIISKRFYIEQHLNGINIDSEKTLLGDITMEPNIVTVTGPETEVNNIQKAIVKYDNFKDKLTDSVSLNLPIVLYDKDGNEIRTKDIGGEHITCDYTTSNIVISIFQIKEVPLVIDFVNYKNNFPIDKLQYILSDYSIKIAGESSKISKYSELSLGYVDISKLNLLENNERSFVISLPKDIRLQDDFDKVTATFDNSNIATKTINTKNIVIKNIPDGYEVKPKTDIIKDIVVIGDKGDIENITSDDFVAEIDMAKRPIDVGEERYSVNIVNMNDNFVWAVGRYYTTVTIARK